MTREAWQVLTTVKEVWLRTARHPIVTHLPQPVVMHSFDLLYEGSATFSEVYAAIVTRVLELGHRPEGVCYCVPGHPWVGEATVPHIVGQARDAGIPVRVVAGLSFVEPMLSALALDALDGIQVVDALDLTALCHPPLNPDIPVLIAQVYSRAVASDLKLVLMNQYPDEHRVALVDAAGTPAEQVSWLPLYEIDRQDVTPLTSLYISPLTSVSSFEGFQQTVARLRAPDGCPWDREQTHESLRTNLLEETYEVLAAIDAKSVDGLCEELGDLLLQIVLHSQIAIEDGEFYMSEVIRGIDSKLKRRHPHVWGDVQVQGSQDVIVRWEDIKRREREANGAKSRSMLDGIPQILPSLAQALEYGKRVARVGLDLGVGGITLASEAPDARSVVEIALGEVLQCDETAEIRDTDLVTRMWGNLLFSIANYARKSGIDLESALRETNAKLANEFRALEGAARDAGVTLAEMDPTRLKQLWREVHR
ncbi:MAG: nucleoside triphosphate pyrophosphohydrolase [Anaerolineae bacterium]|nr:nucleoside triphosphate pyrophosphohydrolase [Anaerolineae bacterium]